jgi:hypothetical protein
VDLIDSDGSTEIEFIEFYGVLTGRIPLDGSASATARSNLSLHRRLFLRDCLYDSTINLTLRVVHGLFLTECL